MIQGGVCQSFRVELMKAIHDFTTGTGDTFKLALYTSAASISPETTVYTTTGEVSGGVYPAGGVTLTTVTPVWIESAAVLDFSDATFPSGSITARGAMIYNASKSNRAVFVFDFGADKTMDPFTVTMPAAGPTTAIFAI